MILNGFQIRKANINDIDNIMIIEKTGFLEGLQESKSTFIDRIKVFSDGFLVLANEDNIVKGYISSEIWNYKENIDEQDFKLDRSIKYKHDPNGDELYISSMGLSNELKDKGWGHILIDYLIDNIEQFYPNLKTSILIVSTDWIKAKKIYLNKDFKEIYTIKNFFKPLNESETDGIVMRKKL